MKVLILIIIFQVSIHFTYCQSTDSLKNDEIQKAVENQLFPGHKFDEGFRFNFPGSFKEINIVTNDGCKLNGVLFKAKQTKGLVFYLHGSNGAIDTWGKIASTYTNLNYDLFMLDYRGYGKSGGKITSEQQLYSDVQEVYNNLKLIYTEPKIIVLGQSIGTGLAAMIAATNYPRMLILQAPYYSLPDWIHNIVPEIDTVGMKYQLTTYKFLQKATTPVVIFHGEADKAIYHGSSLKLSTYFKKGDRLFILKGEGHNDFIKNREYRERLKKILK